MEKVEELRQPCAQCPWRLENQGKRHKGGFYTKANLQRLWNQVRGGGKPQSCHLTDSTHPDHVEAGARKDSTPRECPGSVIVVMREMKRMCDPGKSEITPRGLDRYFRERRRRGMTKRGVWYWAERILLGGALARAVPKVEDSEAIGLPEELREG